MKKGPDWNLTGVAAFAALASIALYAQVPPPNTTDISPPQPIENAAPEDGTETLPAEAPRAAVGVQTNMEGRFGELDVDANGGLSENEVRGDIALRQRFEKLDANDDGQLNSSEFAVGADKR